MSADVLQFDEFESSSRGLMARIILPSNVIAFRNDIQLIEFAVYNRTDGGPPVEGTLVVAEVMFNTLQPWKSDSTGCTFIWPASGALWDLADKEFRVVITFTIINAHANPQLSGKKFRIAYEANTKNPAGT